MTVEALEEYLRALRINTCSMTQGPGLEIKTKVTAHMLCFVLQAILSPLPAGILTEQGKAQETML